MLHSCEALNALSDPAEEEAAFRGRLAHRAREHRDREVARLREDYGRKLARIQDRISRAEERIAQEEGQYRRQRLNTMLSVGETLAGALFGRKLFSQTSVGRAATTARAASLRQRGHRSGRARLSSFRRVADLEQELRRDCRCRAGTRAAHDREVPVRPQSVNVRLFRAGLGAVEIRRMAPHLTTRLPS